MSDREQSKPGLQNYVIAGGRQGRDRLHVIGRVLAPSTARLFDRVGSLAGAHVIDAACGGGEVSLELARRVGKSGHVLGIDLDETKLALAREEAVSNGLMQVEFRAADVTKPW